MDMDVEVEVEVEVEMGRETDDVGNGGQQYRTNNNNSNRRAHYHLPGVNPLNPERTKDLFDMDVDTDTDTENDMTAAVGKRSRSKRPWPCTSASASSAALTHSPLSRERHHEDADGHFTVQHLWHSKSWTCLSDINRLAMARSSSSEDESEEKRDQETSCRRHQDSNNKNEINNDTRCDKTPEQQEERVKLDESDRKMLAAQSIIQWQNNTNQSTGLNNPNYTQSLTPNSTSTAISPHKIMTTTFVAIDDISTSRPTYTATTATFSSNMTTSATTSEARTVPKTEDIASRPTRSFHPFATTTRTTITTTTASTATDDISCYRPTARPAPMRPHFLAFTPIIDDTVMDTTTTTTSSFSVSYESPTTPPPPSTNSPHLSIPSPASSAGRFSPYYYSQLSPYSRAAGAVSPLPARRCSADTSIQMCILQGFLDRHSNGHIMYPKPKPSKCCSSSGSSCSSSGSEEDGEEEEDSSSSTGSSSSPTSFSDAESDSEDQDDQSMKEEDIDEEDEEFQNRMLLLSQSPNLSSVDFREFFMTERQASANTRQADSPVFFQGFPLLNMTRID
ncbi:hypothetical protein BGX30_002824 [Mortierella sp. GBA39]|nr:hypothetical protein BGX30_002824 [Mortierella sp. GBA39]